MSESWDTGSSANGTSGGFGSAFGRGGLNTKQDSSQSGEYRLRGFGRGIRHGQGSSIAKGGGESVGGKTGFGRGGFGRGVDFGRPSEEPNVGHMTNGSSSDKGNTFGKSSGFGSSSGGGFGGKSAGTQNNNNNDEDWGDGGGGSSGGFGSRGFKQQNDEPRGGGFGRGGGDRKSGGCYRCGEDGHMARECPSSGGGGGGGGRGGGGNCHKCGESGHFARECPSAGSSGGGFGSRSGGGGGGGGNCHKCGESGHFARECPSAESGGSRSGGGNCHKCGESGHFARECPSAESGGGGGSGGGNCFKCGEAGHFARECTNEDTSGGTGEKREIYVPPPPPETEQEIFVTMQKGIHFDKYDDIPVEVTGQGKPNVGLNSFAEADIYDTFKDNLKKCNYEKPTPIQKWAIPIIMGGRDLMGCAQTGSGKTAAFLLPVLTGILRNGIEGSKFLEAQEPQAIVIGPTRELVVQIYNEARKYSYGTVVRPVVVYGGTSVGHQARQLEQGSHIVIGTPGRLLDFVGKGKISLAKVKYLILDEADRMLDMGFEPEIRRMIETMSLPAKEDRQTLMFSATFPEQIQKLAGEFLNDYLFVTVGRVGGANTDIEQQVFEVDSNSKREKLVSILNETGTDRTLVFVEQKRNADFLATYLSQSEFPTTSIHGDRLQREREEALRDFKTGRAPILIATSVAARGLDIPNVKHVINYDLPSHIEEYVHRIGRTGRCGNLGKATSFYDSASNNEIARALVKTLQEAQQEVPNWLEEAAQNSFGAGGFQGSGGEFGGRDTRRGRYGGGRGGGRGGRSGGNDGGDNGFTESTGNSGGGGGFEEDDEEAW